MAKSLFGSPRRKSGLEKMISSMIPKPTHNGMRQVPKKRKKKGWF